MADMVKVRSASDFTVVLNAPEIPLVKTWNKRNAVYPIQRDALIQAYYNTSLASLMAKGILIVEDKQFLIDVGIISDESESNPVVELTPAQMKRYISFIPVNELKAELAKLSEYQITELAEFAIANYNELRMDRIDLLSQASHKNILKAIELHKAAQED